MARTPKPRQLQAKHMALLRDIAGGMARQASQHAKPNVRKISKTLARYMEHGIVQEHPTASGGRVDAAVRVPHFWAWYVHQGRGPVRPVVKRYLVWFRNPKDDPRLAGGYPVRVRDVRRLSASQWRLWLDRNEAARKAGLPEPMIVTQISGPVQGRPFFSNKSPGGGMAGFPPIAFRAAHATARDHILRIIGKDRYIRGSLTLGT